MKPVRQTVRVAKQSPLNRLRWLLTLGCGHEVWATQSSRPTLYKLVKCQECTEKLAREINQ